MKYRLLTIIMVLGCLFFPLKAYATGEGASPIQTPSDQGCIIEGDTSSGVNATAEGVLLMDAASGAILYSQNPDTRYYPASITKIMTTLVALENGNLSDQVICKKETLDAIEQGSSRIGLEYDEVISLEDALYFTMLASGNDAAAVAAEHIGGTVDGFVAMMNAKVAELGLTGTHFTNPHGLHSEDHYTTPRDMAIIMQAALQNPDFVTIASATNYTAPASNLNEPRETWNHHKMILPSSEYHYEGVKEGKTGYTSIASNTLVTTAEKDGVKLIAVLLKGTEGAEGNYRSTSRLFDYGFENFKTIRPLANFNLKEAAKNAGLPEDTLERLQRYNATYNVDYSILAPIDVNEADLSLSFTSDGPSEGVFGVIHVSYQGEEIGKLNVYYDVAEEYKSFETENTHVSITSIRNVPFILVGVMALFVLLIIGCLAIMIFRP